MLVESNEVHKAPGKNKRTGSIQGLRLWARVSGEMVSGFLEQCFSGEIIECSMLLIEGPGCQSDRKCGAKSSAATSKNSQLDKGQVGSQEKEPLGTDDADNEGKLVFLHPTKDWAKCQCLRF